MKSKSNRRGTVISLVMLWLGLALGCRPGGPSTWQGYIEGEFVYLAASQSGVLMELTVERGANVTNGQRLFVLESDPEAAAVTEAQQRQEQARAQLADLRQGQRPTEIAALAAQVAQAEAALTFAEHDFLRQSQLRTNVGGTTEQEFDRARAVRAERHQRLVQLQAQMQTAQLGARAHQIAAAEAQVAAQAAALARARWLLAQKSQSAPQAGLIQDTLYRVGEWVPAGRPVVVLLPPGQVKLRCYVPETQLTRLRPGTELQVRCDGRGESFSARVTYLSARAEFTPPVVYTREQRSKFTYLVEAQFAPEVAAQLHPGQPVEIIPPP